MLVALAAAAFTLSSCSNKYAPINELRNLSYEIQNNGSTYDVQDWQKTGKKFAKIQKKFLKYDYTAQESQEIGELTGQCARYFATGVVSNVGGKVISVANLLNGILQGVTGGK